MAVAPAPPGPARVVSWGEILWDLYPDGARLGGAPANLAYHLARLGRPVALISRVGDDDAGRRALAELERAGVDPAAVQRDPARATGAVGVEIVGGEARYALAPDGAWEFIELDAAGRAALGSAAALCFGTLALRRGRAALEAALALLPPDAIVASDPNLRDDGKDDDPELLRWLLAQVDVIKLNDGELATIGRRLALRDPVGWLLERGALVAVTRGARGCTLRRGGEVAEHPGFAARPGGDSVGCGDAFTAVLLHLLLAGAPLGHVAAAACRYASVVAGEPGATPPIERAAAAALIAPPLSGHREV